jgi:8-amino-7-oxononanoate synthase
MKLSRLLGERLDDIRDQNLYRRLRTVESEQGPWIELGGRLTLNLCSNNYLGLASHPRLKEAAVEAAREYGCGSGASRLICGTMSLHEALEGRLAAFKGAPAALVFNSGYMANLGIVTALMGKGDHVFSDELNHASLIDACRLSQAEVHVFRHNDVAALEAQLTALGSNPKGRQLIVVDTVFSMDGDIAPLPHILELSKQYDAHLMVDEAHSTGALGPGGRGAVAHFGLEGQVPIVMGTFSKALGGFGGYVVGPLELREYLINTSRGFIFTTALPPPVLASAAAAVDLLEEQPSLVTALQDNAHYLRSELQRIGYDTGASQSQIIPIIVGDAARTCEMSDLLLEEGVLATAIRPPTVADGTSRIRVSVIASHTKGDLSFAVAVFEKVGRHLGIL